MLVQRRNPALRAYFVWGLFQGADSETRARENAAKYAAPDTTHFWLPTNDISVSMASVMKLGAGRVPFDVYLLYRKGVLWESGLPLPTYWQQQIGLIQGEPFDIMRFEARVQQLLSR